MPAFCREGLTVDDGSQTKDLIKTHYSVEPALIGQVEKKNNLYMATTYVFNEPL